MYSVLAAGAGVLNNYVRPSDSFVRGHKFHVDESYVLSRRAAHLQTATNHFDFALIVSIICRQLSAAPSFSSNRIFAFGLFKFMRSIHVHYMCSPFFSI